jgi:glycosyltransferase involved in cell wall biosynthesis
MNIAYICMDPGIPLLGNKGASNHVREFTCALVVAGHRVTIFTARCAEPGREFPCAVEVVPPCEAEQIEAPGALKTEILSLRQNEALFAALGRANAADRFDLFFERYSLWSCAGRQFADLEERPYVLEVNSPLRLEQKRFRELCLERTARTVEHFLFSSATLLVGVSREVVDYAVRQSGRTGPTLVLPNGVDLGLFENRQRSSSVAEFTVGFVGSLKPWHGIEILLQAFAKLALESDDYRLLIIGDGPLRPWADEFVREHSLQSRVCLTGSVEKERIPELLARVEVAVAPYPEIDGFYFSPLKLFEYMAAGCAIVASNIGQAGEVLRHRETAMLAQPGSVEDLARQIRVLRAEAPLRRSISIAARREAGQKHGWESRVAAVFTSLGACSMVPDRSELRPYAQ